MAATTTASKLGPIVELFEREDAAFLDALLVCRAHAELGAFGRRWCQDARPWARRALLRYVNDGCDRTNHRPLVKAITHHAIRAQDDELAAHLAHAFDRLIRVRFVARSRYDWHARAMVSVHVRKHERPHYGRAERRELYWRPDKTPHAYPLRFSFATRKWLRRAMLRYHRLLAGREPDRFRALALRTLGLYRDEDIERAEHLLDAYTLMGLLYYDSPIVRRDPRTLHAAGNLADLEPAPLGGDVWRGHAEPLLDLLGRSACLFVRRWIVRWLEREEGDALTSLLPSRALSLIESPHPDVRRFALGRLETASVLAKLKVDDWLRMCAVDDPELVTLVARRMRELVDPKRLDLAQLVTLASMRSTPAAELGLAWLRARPAGKGVESEQDLLTVMPLRDAANDAVRAELATWLAARVRERGTSLHLRELCDARHPEARAAALDVLETEPRFAGDRAVWTALSESPWPDVRARLVRHLEARAGDLETSDLARVWASTLLSVHRGSRLKQRALRQLASRIVEREAEAEQLLPLMAHALRSVRAPERTSALAQIARAAFERPALRDAIARHVPELELFAEGP